MRKREVVQFIKDEKLTKKESLYLLYLYDSSKRKVDKSDVKEINIDDIMLLLRATNRGLKHGSGAILVQNRVKREKNIITKLQSIKSNEEREKIERLYYELGLLAYEEGLPIEKSEILLIKRMKKRKSGYVKWY